MLAYRLRLATMLPHICSFGVGVILAHFLLIDEKKETFPRGEEMQGLFLPVHLHRLFMATAGPCAPKNIVRFVK